jgi:hypothetical protein
MTTSMKRSYLEVTFRKGKALSAYLHLPRPSGARADRSDAWPPGLVVDFTADGTPFGVELTAPALVDLDTLNELLRDLRVPEVEATDLAPLRAA